MKVRFGEIHGYRVIGEDGEEFGHVHDLRVRRRAGSARDRADQQWKVVGLVVGGRGIRERVGLTEARQATPRLSKDLVPWAAVSEIDGAERVVRVAAGTRVE